MQEVNEIQEDSYKRGAVHYLDSREVAEIVDKKHADLIRDIKRYKEQITGINKEDPKSKIAFSDFFILSEYTVEGQSRTYPCYLVTKKGCEFIAHKLTGVKGTKFTAAYINRFHEMEDALDRQVVSSLQQFIKQQSELMQAVLARVESLETKPAKKISSNPFNSQSGILKDRMKKLNDMVAEIARLRLMPKDRILHLLYVTMEENNQISLDAYKRVYISESGEQDASTLKALVSYDWIYEIAVDMCTEAIERYTIFG